MSSDLAVETLRSPDTDPVRWFYVLHGVLGRRANWRGFCRGLQRRRPAWGFVLVDLPEHGESPDLAPPHTVEQTARSLEALSTQLRIPLTHGIGHSFGGKVLSAWAQRASEAAEECWLIDSNPGVRPHGQGSDAIRTVLDVLPKLSGEFPKRSDFVDTCVRLGFALPFSQWLAMNLRRTDPGPLHFRPRAEVIQALVNDYFQYDAWSAIEDRAAATRWHLVIGDTSDNYSADARARAHRLSSESHQVNMHIVPEAGHWVHVDAPAALTELLSKESTQ